MRGYEEYLTRYPYVSRNRAERLMHDGSPYFLKFSDGAFAIMPGNSSTDAPVSVDPERETCECNVYRTKKACPHIAAALGIIEGNGGKIPFTDPADHVFACLETLKKTRDLPAYYLRFFLQNTEPALPLLPKKEAGRFLLELGKYLQEDNSALTPDGFESCYDLISGHGFKPDPEIGTLIFNNRQQCIKAAALLTRSEYRCPYSDRQKKQILREVAADAATAKACLPFLASSFPSSFSREQLLDYYLHEGKKDVVPYQMSKLLQRLVQEKPAMYDDFLKLYNGYSHAEYLDLDVSVLQKLVSEGYGDRCGKLLENTVYRMKSLEDYFRIIRFIPHDQFLPAWQKRRKKYRNWVYSAQEWEIEVDFREDPGADPQSHQLDELSCRLLGVILRVRPDMRDEINQTARKMYRQASRAGNSAKMAEAMLLLTCGGDRIAIKYASGWDRQKAKDEELLDLVAVGIHFDCLETILPDIREWEDSYAAGQAE